MQQEIRALTGLRGLAAVWVLCSHLFAAYGVKNAVTGNGRFGVFLFFVLSGFILGYVHDRDFKGSFGLPMALRFWGLRLAKIYPLHAVLAVVWVLLLVPLHIWPTVARDNGAALGLNLLLMQAWGFLPEYTWNMPSWSISIEWLCYLLFPLLCMILRARSLLTLCGLVVVLEVGIYTGAPVALVGFLSGTGPSVALSAGKQALHYFEMFLLGYVVFLIGKNVAVRLVRPLIWDILAGSIVTAISVAWGGVTVEQWFPLASALLILCLAQRGPISSLLMGNLVMRYLGEISYSLYMCHIMAYAVLIWAWYDLFGGKPSLSIALLTALGLSALAYHFVEQPARRAIRKWVAKDRSAFPAQQDARVSMA